MAFTANRVVEAATIRRHDAPHGPLRFSCAACRAERQETLSTEPVNGEMMGPMQASRPLVGLLGESPGIVAVRRSVERLVSRQTEARRLPPILLEGETGTGKGLLARMIQQASPRSGGPLVDINCAAIPETLLEAELFGFERGAFTDARQSKPGLFATADRGTIFLDEVGLLPESIQAKLLKVIEERSVRRLGSTRSDPVDVWIISATNEDLRAATRARRFREDLYHRLAVLTLELPPLRERGDDVCLLAEHFLASACADYAMPPKRRGPDTREALLAYPWPGNVRELSNVIERVVLLSDSQFVTADMLNLPRRPPPRASEPEPPDGAPAPRGAGRISDSEAVRGALEQTAWNISRAAARLGVSRNKLRYWMEQLDLQAASAARPGGVNRRPPASADAGSGAPAGALTVAPDSAEPRWQARRLALLRVILVCPLGGTGCLDSNRQIRTLVDKVQSFGGRIEQTTETDILAAFGLDPVEDAPRRAVLAAVAIQNAAEWSARRGDGSGFLAKIGILIGEVGVGRVSGIPTIDPEAGRAAWGTLDALVAGPPGRILIETAGRAAPRSPTSSSSEAEWLVRWPQAGPEDAGKSGSAP